MKKNNSIDLIKRISIWMVSGSLIWYLIYLFSMGEVIVDLGFLEYNILYYSVLLVVWIYLFLLFAVFPTYTKLNKSSLFIIWLCLLLIGDTILVNNPDYYVYIADFTKILGALLTVLAWTKVFVSSKAKKEKEDKNIEIIEV